MRAVARKCAILEPVGMFAMIMAYIWALRFSHPAVWLGIFIVMLLSHCVRREDAETLGFRSRDLGACLRTFAPALALLTVAMLACGVLLGTTRPITLDRAFFSWAAYLPWGLFQQYVLNGYFLNRFDVTVGRRAAPVVSAALFSGVHTPNWFLMGVTLLAGYVSARLYRRYRNLYFLGLAHGTIGFLLFLVVPDSISHHLTVGPGWYSR
jgi:hypothetical protein